VKGVSQTAMVRIVVPVFFSILLSAGEPVYKVAMNDLLHAGMTARPSGGRDLGDGMKPHAVRPSKHTVEEDLPIDPGKVNGQKAQRGHRHLCVDGCSQTVLRPRMSVHIRVGESTTGGERPMMPSPSVPSLFVMPVLLGLILRALA
jgi:hypothetical protein